jgi:hypothetical protein
MTEARTSDGAVRYRTSRELRFSLIEKCEEMFAALARGDLEALIVTRASAPGAELETALTVIEAYATEELGYCTLEYSQSIRAPGGAVLGPFRFLATWIARRSSDDWASLHWHASPRDPRALLTATSVPERTPMRPAAIEAARAHPPAGVAPPT